MKKMISAILVVTALCCMSMTVFAADTATVGQNGSKEIEVTAKYASSSVTPNVYSVDIEWSSMNFTYTEQETATWNANDHSYSVSTDAGWDKTTATVKVTNHSNVDVNVDVTYTAVGSTGITGTITNGSAALDAGVVGNYAGADSQTATLTISGTPNDAVTADGVKIGTIKVTIG